MFWILGRRLSPRAQIRKRETVEALAAGGVPLEGVYRASGSIWRVSAGLTA